MLIPHGLIVALVDGANFELYRNTGDEADPQLTSVPAPKLDEHNHSGGGHHSSSSNPTGHLADEDAHAAAVAGWLNSQVIAHKIETLAIIAAPRTLGELRKHYHKQLKRIIAKELSKELIGRKPPEILAALRSK